MRSHDSKTGPLDDLTSQPARNETDKQYEQKARFHCGLVIRRFNS
jgi:hypothetical protein